MVIEGKNGREEEDGLGVWLYVKERVRKMKKAKRKREPKLLQLRG